MARETRACSSLYSCFRTARTALSPTGCAPSLARSEHEDSVGLVRAASPLLRAEQIDCEGCPERSRVVGALAKDLPEAARNKRNREVAAPHFRGRQEDI